MDRTRLLSRVNSRSERHFGVPISGSMLDYLVEFDVMPGPVRGTSTVRGANYQYEEEDVRQLTRVRWLKARDLTESSKLRIFLWLAYFDVPFWRVREDVAKEFSNARKRMLRPVSSTFDPTKRVATERDIAILNRQFGPIDPRLMPIGQSLNPLGLVDAYGLMRFGHSGNFEQNVVVDFMKKQGFSSAIDQLGAELPSLIKETSRNLLADPEESETAVEALIAEFDEPSCQRARAILDQLPWLVTKGQPIAHKLGLNWSLDPMSVGPLFKLVARALFQPEFRIGIFVQLVAGIRQGRTEGFFAPSFVRDIRNARDRGSYEARNQDEVPLS